MKSCRKVDGLVLALVVWGLAGCCLPTAEQKRDAEGFVYVTDGCVNPEAPSDYFVIRYESPAAPVKDSYPGLTRWLFIEVRQLKSGVSVLTDGKLETGLKPLPGRNWRKWLRYGARNIRMKFVDADYDLAQDGKADPPEGFVSLFNGKDLTGWRGMTKEGGFNRPENRRPLLADRRKELQEKGSEQMRKHWSVVDGVLFFDGLEGGYNIAAEKEYGNFEAIADWRILRVYGDTGFYLRGLPQVQAWDPNLWNGMGSGCIWNNTRDFFAATECADRAIGDWNRCRMRMIGDKVTVWLNGVKVVDNVTYEYKQESGKGIPLIDNFELQCHGDPVEFRNIFIKELPEAAADIPDPFKAKRGKRIDLLARGLADWEAVDPKANMGWSVKDGVLSNHVTDDPAKMLRGGSGGTHLRTKRADFFDFDMSYDVLVPSKCNSGVYLRGRYEIQVLDSYGRPRGGHNMGALYEHVVPAVSAEKPAGEWQHVDLTLYKRHLTVVLNGVKIIDNAPVPGVTAGAIDGDEFVPGPILLQGDHSNASFRNMFLTPIVR